MNILTERFVHRADFACPGRKQSREPVDVFMAGRRSGATLVENDNSVIE